MEQQKELTEEESLKLISRTIYEAKGYFHESGVAVIIYGFSIFICSILSYLTDKAIITFPFQPFYLFIPVFFVQSYVQVKEEKKKKAKTFTDEAIDFVWTGFFISVLVAFTAIFAGIHYIAISIILILAGLAAFLTGILSKFRYHIITSFLCWLLASVSFFIQNANIYLLLAAVAVLLWIVPGFILNAVFKKQQHG
ncbi:MAG TPA: hypothetical protein PLP23_20195 [Panacibacter sp.]|nr:hypothetical protein [Panacibacter sp.]